MTDDKPSRVTFADIFAKLDQTSYRELLHDTEYRRFLLAKMMADSSDPMLREMGQQVRDGQATFRQLLSAPDYWEALQGGYQKLAEVELDDVSDWVNEIHRQEHDERGDRSCEQGT
jgi:hypothetical protein